MRRTMAANRAEAQASSRNVAIRRINMPPPATHLLDDGPSRKIDLPDWPRSERMNIAKIARCRNGAADQMKMIDRFCRKEASIYLDQA